MIDEFIEEVIEEQGSTIELLVELVLICQLFWFPNLIFMSIIIYCRYMVLSWIKM